MPTPPWGDDAPTVGLPESLLPPIDVALARPAPAAPLPGAMPGGALYEPKWDGFRLVVVRNDLTVSLWSRQGTDLTAAFPEIANAAAQQVPPGFVLDGEAVVWAEGRLDFDALQQRLSGGPSVVAALVRERPASFAAFDLLAVAGRDVRTLPLERRRELLEALAGDWRPPLHLSPATRDPYEARDWYERWPATGIEGLVVKGLAQPYAGGRREWLKVKHRDTVEVVCGAVIGAFDHPESVVVGLPMDGRLRIVGRSSPLRASAARSLARLLTPPRGLHPWPARVPASVLQRFDRDRPFVDLTLVEPVVVEVSADTAWSGRAFRHAVRYVRARPEVRPEDVALPQRPGDAGRVTPRSA
jgi:ATP-dependent DNA ligase